MPDQYLPQSALPIGQTPLDVIRAPQVQTNIPNPLDVTNYFRMQQGIQGNLRLLQQHEELKLRKQEMDLQTYESMVKDIENVTKSTSQLQGQLYSQHATEKGQRDNSNPLGFLDPTYAGHKAVLDRLQPMMQDYTKRIEDAGLNLIKSGSRDPATRIETINTIKNLQNEMQRKIMEDQGFRKYYEADQAWTMAKENIFNPTGEMQKQFGANLDTNEFAKAQQDYEAYLNNDTGYPTSFKVESLHPQRFFYNRDKVMTEMTADIKFLQAGQKVAEMKRNPDGSVIEVEKLVKPKKEEVAAVLAQKYGMNPDAQKLYQNTWGNLMNPLNGQPVVKFDDFINANVNALMPTADDEVITNYDQITARPSSSGGGGGSSDGEKYTGLFSDSDGDSDLRAIEADISDSGFNPAGTASPRSKITALNEALKSDNPPETEYIYVDDKGVEFVENDPEVATHIQYVRKSLDRATGKVKTTVIAKFPKKGSKPKTTTSNSTPSKSGVVKKYY